MRQSLRLLFNFLFILLIFSTCSKDDPIQYSITVQITPAEGGTVSPSSGMYNEGESISLLATPSAEYLFKNWSGGASGTTNPTTVVMTSNKSVTAVFELKDSDGDGLTDDVDTCPNTPSGESVDSTGCSDSQKDSDGDGVTDDVDQCPGTPTNEPVNEVGCGQSQIDEDEDGVMNDVDNCIYTSNTDQSDLDNDGIGDLCDDDIDNDGVLNDVYNPITGRIWMDRNLGATRVATSSTDEAAYGDLYQWGRGADGHQIKTSATTTDLSSADAPGHGDFILTSSSPDDWRDGQNNSLWQGLNGVNNPCPAGYRIPTEVEWDQERTSWISQNSTGAFMSPLKLPAAGYRDNVDGSLGLVGSTGFYWSSIVDGTDSRYLSFAGGGVDMYSYYRATGFPCRCIKD